MPINNSLSSAAIIDGSSYTEADTSYTAPPSPGNCLYFIEVQNAMKKYAGTNTLLFLAIDLFTAEGQIDGNGEEGRVEAKKLSALGYRIQYSKAWTYKEQGEKVPYSFLGGFFTVEELKSFKMNKDYGYVFRFAYNGDGSAVTADDTSLFEPPQGNELSFPAAYADPEFGSYLPRNLPFGFTFESARRVINQEQNSLNALWTKGMGYIQWRISVPRADDKIRITSIADTQNYDLSLYPIPRADSVPDALREIVNNPIFRSEDLMLNVVRTRAYEVSDAGDEPGCRMRFGVLYGDILVEINVKGATPETMFQILEQIKK